MPNKKISQLTPLITPSLDNLTIIVASGVTQSLSIGNLVAYINSHSTSGMITITKDAADVLVSNNNLIVNQLYKITGLMKNKTGFINPTLYDDGNNDGISIYLTAISTNSFSTSGLGEFFNPKYLSFDTYNNGDKTGLYGIWDGENPSSTTTYSIGDVVYWGGYAWSNLTGNIGTNLNILTLDGANWSKIQFSDSNYYIKVIDYVEFDYGGDWLIRRKDLKNNIDVILPFETYWYDDGNYHPISITQWGNNTPYSAITSNSYIIGLSNVLINDSYFETINFKGRYLFNLSVTYTYAQSLYFGKNTVFENCVINDVYFSDIIMTHDYSNGGNAYFGENEIINSYVVAITLSGASFDSNIVKNSGIGGLNMYNYSSFNNNQIIFSQCFSCDINTSTINYNNLISNGGIGSLNIYNSTIGYNNLNNSYIQYNNLSGSNINYNILSNGASIENTQNGIIDSNINNNILSNGSYIGNFQNIGITNFQITYNNLNNGSIISDIGGSNATINNNIITNGGNIRYVSFDSTAHLNNNTIDSGGIYGAYYLNTTISNSSVNYNTLTDESNIHLVELVNSNIQFNSLSNTSYIGYLTLNNGSSFYENTLTQNSGVEGIGFDNSLFGDNVITMLSYIGDGANFNNGTQIIKNQFNNSYLSITLDSTSINNNIFNGTSVFPPPISSKTIQNVNFNNIYLTDDINSATVLYDGSYRKDAFKRQDNTIRLSYYDNSDTLIITNITT